MRLFFILFILMRFSESFHLLRIMTFNIWNSGRNVENGLQKIAKHIQLLMPDIVALQEVESICVVTNLTQMLGKEWTGVIHPHPQYPDTAIITRHTISNHSFANTSMSIGAKITLNSGHIINFWNAHLDYRAYGPYAANNKMVDKLAQILIGENPRNRTGRQQNMEEILNHPRMIKWMSKSDQIPLILAGDFNAPSHFDWTQTTKDIHGGWEVPWPATLLLDQHGFIDSFRSLYSDVLQQPGHTWSTVNKANEEWEYSIPEPQDRIDFIMYKGDVIVTDSFIYGGTEPLIPMPNHSNNDYPSDHYALLTTFILPTFGQQSSYS